MDIARLRLRHTNCLFTQHLGNCKSSWDAIWFVVASTVGHILSVMVAFTVQLKSPPNWLLIPSFKQRSMGYAQPDSPVALFVGGLVGGLLVLIGLSVQMRHENGTRNATLKCLFWSWTGGGICASRLGIAEFPRRFHLALLSFAGTLGTHMVSPRRTDGYGRNRSVMFALYSLADGNGVCVSHVTPEISPRTLANLSPV